MGEQYSPSREEQELFRAIRREVAAHTSEFAECVPWFETEYSTQAIRARQNEEHARVAAEFGEKPERRRPPAITSVAYVRLNAACGDFRENVHDLSSIGRARRAPLIRRVLYVAWLQTDPDAHELGKAVFPWPRSYWKDPDLPAGSEFTRWWARQVGFDPDYDRERVWLKLVRQSLEWFREELPARVRAKPKRRRGGAAKTAPAPAVAEEHIDYATLDECAAVCGMSKRTLERFVKNGALPPPDVRGGGGRAHRWKWPTMRPALEKVSTRTVPTKLPRSRIIPSS